MRRILILATIVLVAVSAFAQVVVYEDTALLEWDGITVDADGSALLPGDVVSYDVYIYDYSVPPLDVQDPAQLIYYGSTTDTALEITFPWRREWAVGVRGTITDGGGVAGTPSAIAWSVIEEDVDIATMGGPFRYVPRVPSPPSPSGLRDQRY
jgi:hypothetical protein